MLSKCPNNNQLTDTEFVNFTRQMFLLKFHIRFQLWVIFGNLNYVCWSKYFKYFFFIISWILNRYHIFLKDLDLNFTINILNRHSLKLKKYQIHRGKTKIASIFGQTKHLSMKCHVKILSKNTTISAWNETSTCQVERSTCPWNAT